MFKCIKFLGFPILLSLFVSCAQNEPARKPISKSKENVIHSSAKMNMELIKSEEDLITNYIDSHSENTYINSKNGFWYTYLKRELKDSIRPIAGNTVVYTYNISTLQDSVLYTKNDIGTLNYLVDKEDILPVLRHSLKLMKSNESIKVVTPSILAYSYLGDKQKIDKNQPLIFTIELQSIEKNY